MRVQLRVAEVAQTFALRASSANEPESDAQGASRENIVKAGVEMLLIKAHRYFHLN